MIAVVIVSYNSADVIKNCLESLVRSEGEFVKIVVVDNASTDATVRIIQGWASERLSSFQDMPARAPTRLAAQCTLIRSNVNLGFAGGVNLGLEAQMSDSECDLFWILNPDCEVEVNTAAAFRRCAEASGRFALMGSRIVYREAPGLVQSEGGRVGRWTGICHCINQGQKPDAVTRAKVDDLDFICGASMVASREFIETAGLMKEDYFLYYEEVEWAARRGSLPLVLCEQALVHHHGGTAIGTASLTRRASPLALYFNYRNRMRFVAHVRPLAFPVACAASLARVIKMAAQNAWPEAWAALSGLCQLPPPKSVSSILSKDAARLAFGKRRKRHG